jgi:hypothetical protein
MITKKDTLYEFKQANVLYRAKDVTNTVLLKGILKLTLVLGKILLKLFHNQFLIMEKLGIKKTPPKVKEVTIKGGTDADK